MLIFEKRSGSILLSFIPTRPNLNIIFIKRNSIKII